jgi:glycolate oxidase
VLWKAEDTVPYECDGLAAYRQVPDAVVLPDTEEQVCAVLRLCHELGVPVVPRGAAPACLAAPCRSPADWCCRWPSSSASCRRSVFAHGGGPARRAQPGHLRGRRRTTLYYAPDPSSQIACTIGGNVAENSGGVHCLKYGLTVHNVLRVRAVTMEGEVVEFGSEAPDAPGLDLLAAMIGSEGMLAVVTEVTVKLIPKPQLAQVIMASFDDVEKAAMPWPT